MRVVSAAVITLTMFVLAPLAAQRPVDAGARLLAIGDIHGAFDELTLILKRAGLVNDRLAWAGGRATLVQTGDYTDRGTDVRKVLDLLMRLEREAKAAGGQVITLLGNHEVMNLIGDWRDVTPEICSSFATEQSESRREAAYKQYARLAPGGAPPPPVYAQTRDDFMRAHPPGCLEYREAMSTGGVYGRWLREKPIAAQVGDTLFMHAGLNPGRVAPKTIGDVNARVRTEIRRIDTHRQRLAGKRLALPSFTLQQVLDVSVAELKHATAALANAKAEGAAAPTLDLAMIGDAQDLMGIGTWSVVDPEGPLWFRGYAQWEETEASPRVFAFLDALKLARVVVGHTVTPDRRITPRFSQRVVLIDTGMLTRTYQGTPAALEISGPTLKAIYPSEEVTLTATPATPVPDTQSH